MIEFIEYGTTPDGETLYARVDEDGLIRYTCIKSDPNYQAWLNPKSVYDEQQAALEAQIESIAE